MSIRHIDPLLRNGPAEDFAEKRFEIHGVEKGLAATLLLWALFQPWAFGGVYRPAQFGALALALLALGLALVPREVPDPADPRRLVRTSPHRLLARLPMFWLGLALLGYVTIQGFNPAWKFTQVPGGWDGVAQPHVAWLPSGYEAPFSKINVWRRLLTWAPPLLAGCAIWLGITRRRVAHFILAALVLNGVGIAALGFLQSATGAPGAYWRVVEPFTQNYASFIYRNHAAAFLIIIFFLGLGYALHLFQHGERLHRRSTPAPVFGLLALGAAAAVVHSGSRGGVLVLLVGTVAFAFLAWRWVLARPGIRKWVAPLFLLGVFGYGAWTFREDLVGQLMQRIQSGPSQAGTPSDVRTRFYIMEAGARMALEHPVFGVGAGGFQYHSKRFLEEAPSVTQQIVLYPNNVIYGLNHAYVVNAHSDLIQIAAELGLVGGGIVFALFACGGAALLVRARLHACAMGSLVALATMFAYAAIDFPTYAPAVVATLVLAGVVSCRLADIEPMMRDR